MTPIPNSISWGWWALLTVALTAVTLSVAFVGKIRDTVFGTDSGEVLDSSNKEASKNRQETC